MLSWVKPLVAMARKRKERRKIEKADDHRILGDGNHHRQKKTIEAEMAGESSLDTRPCDGFFAAS